MVLLVGLLFYRCLIVLDYYRCCCVWAFFVQTSWRRSNGVHHTNMFILLL